MSAFELLEEAVVSTDGFGFLTIGTDVDTIRERHGIHVGFECGGPGLISPDGPDNVAVVTDPAPSGVLVQVSISAGPYFEGEPTDKTLLNVRTEAGVLLGGPASAIDEGHDEDAIELELDAHDPVDRAVMVVDQDDHALVYSVMDGIVTTIVITERERYGVAPCA